MSPLLSSYWLLLVVALIVSYVDWGQLIKLRTKFVPPTFDFGNMEAATLSARLREQIDANSRAVDVLRAMAILRALLWATVVGLFCAAGFLLIYGGAERVLPFLLGVIGFGIAVCMYTGWSYARDYKDRRLELAEINAGLKRLDELLQPRPVATPSGK